MVRRLGVLFGLLGLVATSGGCYWGSQALGSVGGCRPTSGGSPTTAYARTWSRDMQSQQQFIDQYFFNYDVNNPYRCDCPVYDYCPTGCSTGGSSGCSSGCR